MAIAPTADFHELVIEVEFTAGSGTYTKVCGMTNYTVNRSKSMAETMVPDCADESLPYTPRRSAMSKDYSITGTGVWARSHHQNMMDWFQNDTTLNVRVRHVNVTDNGTSGDTETETIPMKLQDLNNARQDKQVVTAEVTFVQDGAVTLGTLS